MKMTIVKPRQSAIVYRREGLLKANVEPSFLEIETETGNILISRKNKKSKSIDVKI